MNTTCHNYQDLFHSQECHVRRCVTQLLGLLFPSASHKLEPLEAVLVYQHFFVLKCLMENVTRVQDCVQEQFEEEFRLVIGKAEIQNRIMFRYIWSGQWSQKVDLFSIKFRSNNINHLTPNDHYIGRTAPLTSKHCILYIYSTNIGTEYSKHGVYSPFFSLQMRFVFIILTYLIRVLLIFYIQGMLKLKK